MTQTALVLQCLWFSLLQQRRPPTVPSSRSNSKPRLPLHFEVVLEREQHRSARAREIHVTEQTFSWENNIKFQYKDKSKNNRKETMFLTVGTIFSEINLLFQGKVYRTIKYTTFRHSSFDIVQCMLEWIHAWRYQKETFRLTNARRERKHSIKFKWLNCGSNLIFWSALSLKLVNDWMAWDFHCCSIQSVCSTYDLLCNCQTINKNYND